MSLQWGTRRGVSARDDVCVCARALSNQRRNLARPIWSLLNTQTRSKKIDADKRLENCFPRELGATRGNGARTSLSDWTASLFSWTRAPNKKMGRLYAGAANGLRINDNTWET